MLTVTPPFSFFFPSTDPWDHPSNLQLHQQRSSAEGHRPSHVCTRFNGGPADQPEEQRAEEQIPASTDTPQQNPHTAVTLHSPYLGPVTGWQKNQRFRRESWVCADVLHFSKLMSFNIKKNKIKSRSQRTLQSQRVPRAYRKKSQNTSAAIWSREHLGPELLCWAVRYA